MSSSVATNRWPSSADRAEPCLHLAQLGVREEPGRVQPARVHERRLAVVREQLAVVGAQEAGDLGGKVGLDAGGPERHTAASLPLARGRELGLERGDLDEALRGRVREDLARAVGGEPLGVERLRRAPARDHGGAGAQLEPHLALDELLRRVHEGVDRLAAAG